MDYTALEVKTSYSILSSICNIQKLVTTAVSYGYKSLAITDENNMFGVMEFYLECQKQNIKPIIGIELTIEDSIVILYAKNKKGYKNIIKLSTIKSSKELTEDDLKKYKDNLILVMPFSYYNENIYNIYEDKFIGYTSLEERNKITKPKVLINNVRYILKEDDIYLDYACMIKESKILGEYEFNQKKGSHLLTKEEVSILTTEEDIKNTIYIRDNCNVELTYTSDLLPVYNENINSKEYLHQMSNKGLNKRLNNKIPLEYQERLAYELKIIDEMGFNDYFLIVYDYVLYAKKHNILVGPGRGSAAGSLVSYSLGITDIDPIKYNLLFERFLNKERVTMPDIDVDFDANKRDEVIEYVINKYGNKKVVGIITFNTLGAKQVIRDVGRILSIKNTSIDSICKMLNSSLLDSYNDNPNLKKIIDLNPNLKKLYQISLKLEGLPRHISIHPAGVVMSKYDIDETIPLYLNQNDMYLSAYSKDYLEQLGLLKMDFLSLANLTLIDEVITNIREDQKINITFNNIPLEDKATINMFKEGNTSGIFQFEKPGMIRFLKQLKPTCFSDIVAAISLYRPGPMDSIPEYIKNRNTGKINYIDKSLEPVLKETYGIIIYQEQIMNIACIMANYSLGEADILRRAMSKKKESILLEEKDKFINGCIKNNYTKETSLEVYNLILKFANYGYNKSHAVSYAMISYKMAFLKTHFFNYYMVSLLNNNKKNALNTSTYIALLRQKNIKVILPNINISTNIYQIKNNEIICPLSIIQNIDTNIPNTILKEREKSPFESFEDFCIRVSGTNINRNIIELLIHANCFRDFGYNTKTLINNLDNILNYAYLAKDSGLITIEKPLIDEYPEYTKEELIEYEYKTFGIYLTYHPVSNYRKNINENTTILENNVDKYITLFLEVNNIKEIITKKNDVMAFLRASDEYNQIDITLFPKTYQENNELKIHDIIEVTGKVEKRLDNYQLIASNIKICNKK